MAHKKHYFDGPVSSGFVSLYSSKLIISIAVGLLGMFFPIFLYNLFGQNFQLVVLYYGLGFLLYLFTVAAGAIMLDDIGFRWALRASVFVGAASYIVYYFMDVNNLSTTIPIALFLSTLYRVLYWVPYHVNFTKFTNKKNIGRQVSAVLATQIGLKVLMPLVAGVIITLYDFDVLFIMGIIIFFASGIPYLTIPRTREKYSWGYFETWKNFLTRITHKTTLAFIAAGAETMVGIVVWPIFIFELLNGNYFQVGLLSTLIVGATVVVQLMSGKYLDKKIKKEKMLAWGSVLYSLGWVVKVFIITAFEIFFIGVYHSMTAIMARTPFDAMTYEMAADEGQYIDEFTVIKEMALQTGRVLMTLIILAVTFIGPIKWVFIFAAIASLFFHFLRSRDLTFV
ncbi:hypothetical protein COB55_05750 [Candidatus Wolfebacteria bacterium]|nr:MAG: hypothetical protein COB55_05750 [Candidatus Wolfebacteria bacterium]